MEDQTQPSIEDWLALQARLTSFHASDEKVERSNIADWWSNAFGDKPERIEEKPREGALQLTGDVPQGQLTVYNSTTRTDFILEPTSEQVKANSADWPVLALGPYWQAIEGIAEPVKGWLDIAPPAYRLALGAILLLPAPSLDSVYRVLGELLPGLNLNGISTPDFLYRINRQRSSRQLPCVVINRLAAWSTAQGQNITITAGSGQPRPGPMQYAAHLELDINSSTEEEHQVDAETAQALLQELIELGAEITKEGDKP